MTCQEVQTEDQSKVGSNSTNVSKTKPASRSQGRKRKANELPIEIKIPLERVIK